MWISKNQAYLALIKKIVRAFDGFCYSLEELDLGKDSAYCVIPSGIMSQVEFFFQYR